MGYSTEEAIADHVVPAMELFLKSEKESEHLEVFIARISGAYEDYRNCDRTRALILRAMFPERRPGQVLSDVMAALSDECVLKEIRFEDGSDLIIEKFNQTYGPEKEEE